jgi:hypothetical protein
MDKLSESDRAYLQMLCHDMEKVLNKRNLESQNPIDGLERVKKEPERLKTVFPVSSKDR